ncbi:hypothetical protein JCM10049v2_005765 [Rhodotorula toruloides]
MMTEDDPIKRSQEEKSDSRPHFAMALLQDASEMRSRSSIPTPRMGTPARMGTPRIATPARIPTPMPAHTQSEAAVFYQFLEAHEDHSAAPTPTDVWHNASSLFAFMVGSA